MTSVPSASGASDGVSRCLVVSKSFGQHTLYDVGCTLLFCMPRFVTRRHYCPCHVRVELAEGDLPRKLHIGAINCLAACFLRSFLQLLDIEGASHALVVLGEFNASSKAH